MQQVYKIMYIVQFAFIYVSGLAFCLYLLNVKVAESIDPRQKCELKSSYANQKIREILSFYACSQQDVELNRKV